MHTSGFAKLLARAGDEAKMGFKVHPHGIPAATRWPIRASIPEHCRPISTIALRYTTSDRG
jgi:hypothetical protein